MKKVWFFFDYGSWPVWYQDEDMDCRSPELPPCIANNKELYTMMQEIENEYEGLFINNSYEFTFVGFGDEESWNKFKEKVDKFLVLLKEAVEHEYEVDFSSWEYECKTRSLMYAEEPNCTNNEIKKVKVKTIDLLIYSILEIINCYMLIPGLIALILWFTNLKPAIRKGDMLEAQKAREKVKIALLVGLGCLGVIILGMIISNIVILIDKLQSIEIIKKVD